MLDDDYLHLFYLKFKYFLPIKDLNFELKFFLKEFRDCLEETVNMKEVYNYKEALKILKRRKNLFFECIDDSKKSNEYIFKFSIIKSNKTYYYKKIKMINKKTETETYYNKKICNLVYFDKSFSNWNYNFLVGSNRIPKNLDLTIYEYKNNNFYEKKLKINDEIIILNEQKKLLNYNLYLQYNYDINIIIDNIEYYFATDENYIDIKYEFKSNKYIENYQDNVSKIASLYLNDKNKKIEDFNEDDLKMINILNYE